MEENLRQRGNPKGQTSAVVAQRVRQVRNGREMDLKGLSQELGKLGWPISVPALSRLENGERRVDVDDLVALSAALNTSPVDLLLPDRAEPGSIGTAIPDFVLLSEAQAWGRGDTNLLPEALLDYWQGEAMSAAGELEYLRTMLGSEDPKARAWANRQIQRETARKSAAEARINELRGLIGSNDG